MKIFNSLDEIQPYYNEDTNTYEFIENQKMIDVEFNFDLNIDRNIKARDINAWNIKAENIIAGNIKSCNIKAENINACDIKAGDINAIDINAWDINANNINAWYIKASSIEFYAVCFSYKMFVCDSIRSRRENSRYFCLDSHVIINKKED